MKGERNSPIVKLSFLAGNRCYKKHFVIGKRKR
jgi:hypothetical protein